MQLDKAQFAKARNWSIIWMFSSLIFLVIGILHLNNSRAATFSFESAVSFIVIGIAIQLLARQWYIPGKHGGLTKGKH